MKIFGWINKMPHVPKTIENAQCPYCYDGIIIYDSLTKIIFCEACNKIVKIKGGNIK